MKHSQWMPILLAAGLAWNAAQRAAGETIEYSGDPDHPFPGAWDPDIVCEKGENTPETECWKCEGESPSVEVPKYEWILTRECPTFSMSNTVQSNCYCVLVGGELSDNITADCVAEDGRKYYEPSIEGCGGEPPEEETITLTIEWNWTTSGLTTVPASGQGQTASFKYTVPKGPFAIDVSFSAIAIPSDTNCAEIATGPEVVGQISGGGYELYSISPVRRVYPPPKYVEGLLTGHDNDRGFGRIKFKIMGPKFMCEEVCSGADCNLYRLEGACGIIVGDMEVASCIEVVLDICGDMPKGTCRPRYSFDIKRTIAHEKKHLDLWWDFIDYWNNEIMNMGLFDSCDFAEDAGEELVEKFNEAYAIMKQQQESHCPHFAGDLKFAINGCGYEFPYGGDRACP